MQARTAAVVATVAGRDYLPHSGKRSWMILILVLLMVAVAQGFIAVGVASGPLLLPTQELPGRRHGPTSLASSRRRSRTCGNLLDDDSNSSGRDDTGWYDDDNDDDDDDDAGDTDVDEKDRSDRSVLLRELREQQEALLRPSDGGRNGRNLQGITTERQGGERDLFVPVFALVALTGFVGAYGYEMVRLYLCGELYLPWTSN